MWYKVQELQEKRLNISQISRDTGLDRATVRRYIVMDEAAFHEWIGQKRHVPMKLSPYLNFVRELLTEHNDLSAAQIEDRLREQFPKSLPEFHSKTVYNFVRNVRSQYGIAKVGSGNSRDFMQLPEVDYGSEAQVDFGETYLQNAEGKRVKVHFFVMVLCRSRQKFVCFELQSFTASSAIYAHELSFEYFEGIPLRIIYDQDSVFIYDENLGDYKLTAEFSAYCKTRPFKQVFCRKSDPQSKGKVENVVKYVKMNFLRGRKFISLDVLNHTVLEWLGRTANAKVHSTTRKIPHEEWLIEKQHLQVYQGLPQKPVSPKVAYNVRKDNTVSFRGNFYSLPLGTYTGKSTKILLEAKDGKLYLYNADNQLITAHDIHYGKGEQIRNSGHWRDHSQSIAERTKSVLEQLGGSPNARLYLEGIRLDKSRYYNDNLTVIQNKLKDSPLEVIEKSLVFCIENRQFNGADFCKVVEAFHKDAQSDVLTEPFTIAGIKEKEAHYQEIETEKSSINTYEKFF